jgi:lysyl-tRNA synthetase class 2
MKEIWMKYVGVNLDDYLIEEKMHELCIQLGYKPKENEPYEDLFYRIFLNKIEPNLGIENPVIIYNYPAQMASLARLNQEDPRYAERFELYANGIELANAFSELTDSVEQEKRLLEEKKLRQKLNKDVYDIDHEFVSSLTEIKSAAGIALGVDRLIQVLLGCKNIDEVLVLPMSLLIN